MFENVFFKATHAAVHRIQRKTLNKNDLSANIWRGETFVAKCHKVTTS